MKTIWKYKLDSGYTFLEMPEGADLLSVQVQDDEWTLWARVDPDAQTVKREVFVCGTGKEILEDGESTPHIETIQQDGFVWHFFDGGETKL